METLVHTSRSVAVGRGQRRDGVTAMMTLWI